MFFFVYLSSSPRQAVCMSASIPQRVGSTMLQTDIYSHTAAQPAILHEAYIHIPNPFLCTRLAFYRASLGGLTSYGRAGQRAKYRPTDSDSHLEVRRKIKNVTTLQTVNPPMQRSLSVITKMEWYTGRSQRRYSNPEVSESEASPMSKSLWGATKTPTATTATTVKTCHDLPNTTEDNTERSQEQALCTKVNGCTITPRMPQVVSLCCTTSIVRRKDRPAQGVPQACGCLNVAAKIAERLCLLAFPAACVFFY